MNNNDEFEIIIESSFDNSNLYKSIPEKFNDFIKILYKTNEISKNIIELYTKYIMYRKNRAIINQEKFDLMLTIIPRITVNYDNFINDVFIKAMQNESMYFYVKDYKFIDKIITAITNSEILLYKYLSNLSLTLPIYFWKVFIKKYLNKLEYMNTNDICFILIINNYKKNLYSILRILKKLKNIFYNDPDALFDTKDLNRCIKRAVLSTDIIFNNINLNFYNHDEYLNLFKIYIFIRLGINSLIILSNCLNTNFGIDKNLKNCLEENDSFIIILLHNFDYLNGFI